jgi:hypothetical protein
MMVFQADVFGTWMQFGSICELNAAFIIFEHSRVSNCITDNQLSGFGEFMKEVTHRKKVASGLRHSNVFRFGSTKGDF